jgi:hypothetical protein
LSKLSIGSAIALIASGACTRQAATETVACEGPSLGSCDGGCVQLDYDPKHCGACGRACASGEVCSLGKCASSCAGGLTECNAACVDIQRDPAHCGACGKSCAAGQVCSKGKCASSCGTPTIACAGACVDLLVDPKNCGGCGIGCKADEICKTGKCAGYCADNAWCDGKCVDTSFDPKHCGGCFKACAAGEICVDGSCGIQCGPTATSCGGKCVDTKTDVGNCGKCGQSCKPDEGCVSGQCCPLGSAVCNGTCANLSIDESHCGECGKSCSSGELCVQGKCQFKNSCLAILKSDPTAKNGLHTLDPDGKGGQAPFVAHCDMSGGGWTLIARFAVSDADNWLLPQGSWWYDKITEAGLVSSRSDNADMISAGFWSVPANEMRISRTDFDGDYPLLSTTGNCLGSTSFRAFITGFGDYRKDWTAGGAVKASCSALLSNGFATTSGFSQATCSVGQLKPDAVHFWTVGNDSAVMTIGGGTPNGSACNDVDHGIGIASDPSFNNNLTRHDFGDEAWNAVNNPGYALNLLVR